MYAKRARLSLERINYATVEHNKGTEEAEEAEEAERRLKEEKKDPWIKNQIKRNTKRPSTHLDNGKEFRQNAYYTRMEHD